MVFTALSVKTLISNSSMVLSTDIHIVESLDTRNYISLEFSTFGNELGPLSQEVSESIWPRSTCKHEFRG